MEDVLLNIENYVTHYLNEHLKPSFLYHNLVHTQRVVEKTKELIEHSQLSTEDSKRLITAAWFHDIGHTVDPKNHEEEGVKITVPYLKEQNFTQEDIDVISQLILATKMDHVPTTMM